MSPKPVVPEPVVSVIVPTFRRPDSVERTVRAWAGQRFDGELEIVVVDDGSGDDTTPRLQALAATDERIVPLQQANRGAAAARNAGLDRARGRWVLFADDDISPVEPDTVARWLARTSEEGGAWVARMRVPPEAAVTTVQQAWRGHLESGPKRWRDGHRFGAGGFWFAALMMERSRLGDERFDERLAGYGWEDMELGYRLTRLGVGARLARAVQVWHSDPVTLSGLERKYEALGRNGWAFVRRHPRLGVRLWTGTWLPVRVAKAILRLEERGRAAKVRIAAVAGSRGVATPPRFGRDLRTVLEGAYARGTRLGAPQGTR